MNPFATCLVACLFGAVSVAAVAQDCMTGTMVHDGDDVIGGETIDMPMRDSDADLADGQGADMMQHCEPDPEAVRLYQERCIFCHDSAAELARSGLILKEDGLYGRYSGRLVAAFLMTHGRLAPSQVPMMVDLLEWHLTLR